MDIEELKKIPKDAIEAFGLEAQIDQTIEECAELIHALNKVKRYPAQSARVIDVRGEIADVEIMCEQMRAVFDDERSDYSVDSIKASKLVNLAEMISWHFGRQCNELLEGTAEKFDIPNGELVKLDVSDAVGEVTLTASAEQCVNTVDRRIGFERDDR